MIVPEDILKRFKELPGPCGQYGLLITRKSYKPNLDMDKYIQYSGNIKNKSTFLSNALQMTADYLIEKRVPFDLYEWKMVPCGDYVNMKYIPWIKFRRGNFHRYIYILMIMYVHL